MRGLIYSVVFVVLLLVGFLVTPGVVRLINAEYWVAVAEYSPKASALTDSILEKDRAIRQAKQIIDDIETDLNDAFRLRDNEIKGNDSNSQAGLGPTASEVNKRVGALLSDRDQQAQKLKSLQEERQSLSDSRTEINKIIEKAGADSINLYLVARALALGAIGALMSIMVKFETAASGAKGRQSHVWFDDHSIQRLWTSTAIGAVVSVVALGLFHTKQITIFSNGDSSPGQPEFWRVTILCLMAGAFSDRLFQAASQKVGAYIGDSDRTRSIDDSVAAQQFHERRASRRKKPKRAKAHSLSTKPALVEVNKEITQQA
jgi:hypothetical protein